MDYKKYLGPDWKNNKKERYGMIVSNHSSFFDHFVAGMLYYPSFLAKIETKNYFAFKQIAFCFNCLFVDRQSDKESKLRVLNDVIER